MADNLRCPTTSTLAALPPKQQGMGGSLVNVCLAQRWWPPSANSTRDVYMGSLAQQFRFLPEQLHPFWRPTSTRRQLHSCSWTRSSVLVPQHARTRFRTPPRRCPRDSTCVMFTIRRPRRVSIHPVPKPRRSCNSPPSPSRGAWNRQAPDRRGTAEEARKTGSIHRHQETGTVGGPSPHSWGSLTPAARLGKSLV